MNIQDNSQLTIKKFNLLEKIIHTYECIHKQDALYPALIMSVTCVIVSGLMELNNSNLTNYMLGYYNLVLNNDNKAVNYLSQVDPKELPNPSNFNLSLATAYTKTQQYKLAEATYLKELKINPCHKYIIVCMAYNDLLAKNYDKVLALTNTFLNDHNYYYSRLLLNEALLYKAIANYNLNNIEEARADLDILLSGKRAEPIQIMANYYKNLISKKTNSTNLVNGYTAKYDNYNPQDLKFKNLFDKLKLLK